MSTATLKSPQRPRLSEDRFRTAPVTLFMDRFMTHFIKASGAGIIAAVIGIFLFIFSQTLPLFRGARVQPLDAWSLGSGDLQVLGVDEWGELPFAVDRSGVISFVDVKKGKNSSVVNPVHGLEGVRVSAFDYNENHQQLIYGTEDGRFFTVKVGYKPVYEGNERTITAAPVTGPVFEIASGSAPVLEIAEGQSDERTLVAAIQREGGEFRVRAVLLERETSLFGSGDLEIRERYDLTEAILGTPEKLLVNSMADEVLVATREGKIFYFAEDDGNLRLRQVIYPFEGDADPRIASFDYIFGEVSFFITGASGKNVVYSLFVPEGGRRRSFHQTKEFKALDGAAEFGIPSVRNKAFLIGSGSYASLRYSTTEAVRWEEKLPFRIRLAAIGPKYNRLYFLDDRGMLHAYELDDPHPEAGFKAFFGKIWYEGYPAPSYEWQSTGGSDEFEPKLSLIPLIIGTLKGTFYAMIFALPIALLAALYTAQFAHPRFKARVKPCMEIMASLPSVVLGFLAALWLAPAIEDRMPSVFCVLVMIPGAAFLAGWLWTSLPIRYRKRIKPGYEWLPLIPLLLLAAWAGWSLGPAVERTFFVVTDPETGIRTADFRLWWPAVTGLRFEQRNSMVVGFMMGFAVIPIIFTIAEDALSNVPRTLISGSLALGASRWQTAVRVVLPTALPGIFSAVMIGLGRAIGETMIVVMATGNTPVMDWNIFSGMRTLSANIAVELPEAPYLGTLYRTLFFGAVVLFMMTFVMNTVAEVIRQHIREKYRTV